MSQPFDICGSLRCPFWVSQTFVYHCKMCPCIMIHSSISFTLAVCCFNHLIYMAKFITLKMVFNTCETLVTGLLRGKMFPFKNLIYNLNFLI